MDKSTASGMAFQVVVRATKAAAERGVSIQDCIGEFYAEAAALECIKTEDDAKTIKDALTGFGLTV